MIVLVAGLPGSGKSYFASKLAARLGGVYVSSDKVRKALDALGEYTFSNKMIVYVEMIKIANRVLKEQKTVVVDATFYQVPMRNLFYKLADKHASKICLIVIKANETLIKERLSKPRQDSEADFKVYEQIRDQFQKIISPHLEMESTNSNITTMLNRAIEYIGNVHEGE
jgi:predicted kinase